MYVYERTGHLVDDSAGDESALERRAREICELVRSHPDGIMFTELRERMGLSRNAMRQAITSATIYPGSRLYEGEEPHRHKRFYWLPRD